MTNIATGKPFWKAIVLSGVTGLNPREVVQRLIKDGVLSGKVTVNDSRYQ